MTTRLHFLSATLATPILMAAILSASPASADIVTLGTDQGGPWKDFVFEPNGAAWDDEFHFHLDTPGFLEVTDAYQQGDIFDVNVNGADFGQTSDTTPDPNVTYYDNFEAAFESTIMSHGSWLLEAGDYVVKGTAAVTPFGNPGGAAIRVEAIDLGPPTGPTGPTGPTDPTDPTGPMSATPEPESWALMILGFGGVGVLLRRRPGRALTVA